MKIPYSYRQHFFIPVLTASFLGHVTFFAAGAGFLSLSPEYGVEHAPSSMEVVMTKIEPEKKQENTPSKVLTAAEPVEKTETVKEIEQTKQDPPQVSKPVYIPPQRGALQQKPNAYLKNPAPVYPQLAREREWEGLVMLAVFVEKDGNPGQVNIEQSSGYKILDDAAVKAVTKWQFKPAAVGDVSFAAWIRIPVRFTLVEDNGA